MEKQLSISDMCSGSHCELTQKEYYDPYCTDEYNNQCLLCRSMSKYIDHPNFQYKGQGVKYSSNYNDCIYVDSENSIKCDLHTAALIINQAYEKLLKEKNITSSTTLGKTCSNTFRKYVFKANNLSFDEILKTSELTRKIKEIPKDFPTKEDIPLKSTTVQNIILNLVEIFKICIDGKILPGLDILIDNITFCMNKTFLKFNDKSIESRFRLIIPLPILSSALINGKHIGNYIPHFRVSPQEVISYSDGYSKVANIHNFIYYHQTGKLPFSLGCDYTFLLILLQYCCYYQFAIAIYSDDILLKMWEFIWGDELDQVKEKIIQWLEVKPSLDEIKLFLFRIKVKKNIIEDLSSNLNLFFS